MNFVEIMNNDGFLTAKQTQKVTGLTVQTLYNMARTDQLKAERVGGRVFFSVASLTSAFSASPTIKRRLQAFL